MRAVNPPFEHEKRPQRLDVEDELKPASRLERRIDGARALGVDVDPMGRCLLVGHHEQRQGGVNPISIRLY